MALPPILMIHGMWSRPSTFAQLRAELEPAGIRSAAVTLPHHDVPPGSPAPTPLGSLRIANYLSALERDAADMGETPVIMGHSMGGILAQLLAERLQPKGLILLSTAPSMQASGSATSLSTLRATWGISSRWGWWSAPTLLDEEGARFGVFNGVPEAEIRPALNELTWDSGPVLAQLAAPFLDPDKGSRVDYSKLKMPTLVITGLDDHILPAAVSRKTARLLSSAGTRVDYEEWAGVGHWLFHDAVRPRLAAAISRFMASLG
ncbi:alpha/beta hydrolase [Sandaracinobacter neustonicus]|uniref:Alpha/beta hydrolase n=1 Tax=Sandaracinobacter neustonicus TaxID=1715348 RepID=A0A501XM38_9SPHN|nr:alpha/beta hydrolase [Sandaracinobacter neustonicus]TPE61741.1 alpha/beta hydrolase [Sandaracinobacter neustonicus]